MDFKYSIIDNIDYTLEEQGTISKFVVGEILLMVANKLPKVLLL